jgi:hypothetical protein
MDVVQEITSSPDDEFQNLVKDISIVLGPSSGIDSADVDPQELIDLMRSYTSNAQEWERYAFGDGSRTYTRNLVDKGNGKSNLVSRDPSTCNSSFINIFCKASPRLESGPWKSITRPCRFSLCNEAPEGFIAGNAV